jgi:hypothetical protein
MIDLPRPAVAQSGMPKRSELSDVHYHLAEALFALGKIVGPKESGALLPIVGHVMAAQKELLKLSRRSADGARRTRKQGEQPL